MKTCPGAAYKPLGPQTEPRMTGHDIVCLHTMVGYLSSTDGYFRGGNGVGYAGTESHFGVGGKWGKDGTLGLDGTVWQWQDLAYQADANLDGNPTVISVETADNAARPIQPWTPLQCEGIARLLAWLCSVEAHAECPSSWTCHREGIPLALIPDTKPGRRGIGYHRQGCDPWRVLGGVRWSPSRGKDCPTEARIAQIPAVIARAIEITTHQEDDIMATLDELRAVVRQEIMDAPVQRQGGMGGDTSLRTTLAYLDANLATAKDTTRISIAVKAAVEAVAPEVSASALAAEIIRQLAAS